MKRAEYPLSGTVQTALETEIMFLLATEKVNGCELVSLTLQKNSDEPTRAKEKGIVTRLLRRMKSEGKIQFFATGESFVASTTEAKYLINKYPDIIDGVDPDSGTEYFYVKL